MNPIWVSFFISFFLFFFIDCNIVKMGEKAVKKHTRKPIRNMGAIVLQIAMANIPPQLVKIVSLVVSL